MSLYPIVQGLESVGEVLLHLAVIDLPLRSFKASPVYPASLAVQLHL
jgi:hypothetical protein